MSHGLGSSEPEILEHLESVLQRWYAGDPLAYTELFADDLTYFAPVWKEGRLEGITALRDVLAPFKDMTSVPGFKIIQPKLQMAGEAAVLTYNLNEYAEDGSVRARWNATEVYHKIGETWRILHAHWSSVPLE